MLDPAEPGLRQVLLLMGPGTLGLAATQVNVFVNTWLATGEGHRRGVVARLRLSADVPAAGHLRRLDRHGVAAGHRPPRRRAATSTGMRETVSSSLAMMLTLNVPATIGLIVLAHPIVALLFERGQFTPPTPPPRRARWWPTRSG